MTNELLARIGFLEKENQELKSQLAGTTHCFDEEEHRKLEKENNELKKQLEKCYCNRTDCSSRIKNSKKYDSLVQTQEVQQKEFIKYLEDEWTKHEYISAHEIDDNIRHTEQKIRSNIFVILQKYKEIIGDDNNVR